MPVAFNARKPSIKIATTSTKERIKELFEEEDDATICRGIDTHKYVTIHVRH